MLNKILSVSIVEKSKDRIINLNRKLFVLEQNTQPTLYLDKILDLNTNGLAQTRPVIQNLNEPDVDLYAWIGNTPAGSGYGGMGYIGGNCDNQWNLKTSLTRGPSRGVIETAEVI